MLLAVGERRNLFIDAGQDERRNLWLIRLFITSAHKFSRFRIYV